MTRERATGSMAVAVGYVALMAAGFWGAGTEDSPLAGLLLVGVLSSGFVAYVVPGVAALLPPVALMLAVAVGAATNSFDNEYGWIGWAAGLLLAEAFVEAGVVARRRSRRATKG